jgi:hypothetical protein
MRKLTSSTNLQANSRASLRGRKTQRKSRMNAPKNIALAINAATGDPYYTLSKELVTHATKPRRIHTLLYLTMQ